MEMAGMKTTMEKKVAMNTENLRTKARNRWLGNGTYGLLMHFHKRDNLLYGACSWIVIILKNYSWCHSNFVISLILKIQNKGTSHLIVSNLENLDICMQQSI